MFSHHTPTETMRKSAAHAGAKPVIDSTPCRVRVVFNGIEIANSHRGVRVVSPGQSPTIFVPLDDVRMAALVRAGGNRIRCEWRGETVFYDIYVADLWAEKAALILREPTTEFLLLQGFVSFSPWRMDAVWVDGERLAGTDAPARRE